jgi:hypothetical protein
VRLCVNEHECAAFTGGMSICSLAMANALSAVEFDDRLRILELGSGAGTQALVNLLDKLVVPFEYQAYENDPLFVCSDSRVHTTLWDGANFPKSIGGQFDFVIVDGPNGKTRAEWYPLLKSVVTPGTVLLIDDYYHHEEFERALNECFSYETIDRKSGSHECWKTVRILAAEQTLM